VEFRKKEGSGGGDDRLAVMVQPLAGHSDEEVVELLASQGAEKVAILAPGFISAETRRSTLGALQTVARVEPKARKVPHRR
jgi:hypothetical protein